MNITLHPFGRPFLHFVWTDHIYITVTALGRRWHYDNLPSYPYPND